MKAVPFFGALTMFPFATSTRDLEDPMSVIRSSSNGVMWLEQPESISNSDSSDRFEGLSLVHAIVAQCRVFF